MKKILLVEDTPYLQQTIKNYLKRKCGDKHIIYTANNGIEALEIVNSKQNSELAIDIVITDFQMPEMNGLQLIDELPLNIPVILLSSDELSDIVFPNRKCVFLHKTGFHQKLYDLVEKMLDKTSI